MRYLISTLLLILLSAPALVAESYTVKSAKGPQLNFAPDPKRALQSGQKEQVFYREGYISESAKVVTTGYLKIRLDAQTDPKTFADQHGLQFVKVMEGRLFLFKNSTSLNDMALAAKLGNAKGVLGAIPRFQGRKTLK